MRGPARANVIGLSEAGATVRFDDGSLGHVPADELFVGHRSPIINAVAARHAHSEITLNQRILLLPLSGDQWSRTRAALATFDDLKKGDLLEGTVRDLTNSSIYIDADNDVPAKLSRQATLDFLLRTFGHPRLSPDRSKEADWLYVGDRVRILVDEVQGNIPLGRLLVEGFPLASKGVASAFSWLGSVVNARNRAQHGLGEHDEDLSLSWLSRRGDLLPERHIVHGLESMGRAAHESSAPGLDILLQCSMQAQVSCAGTVFAVHKITGAVRVVSSSGDEAILRGLRSHEHLLRKNPVRDLAVDGQSVHTDDARHDNARYRYLLEALGGCSQPLSVQGFRLDAVSQGPYAYVAMLFSRAPGAFGREHSAVRQIQRCALELIQTALRYALLVHATQTLIPKAARAFDYSYLAHEAVASIAKLEYLTEVGPKADERSSGIELQRIRDCVWDARECLDEILSRQPPYRACCPARDIYNLLETMKMPRCDDNIRFDLETGEGSDEIVSCQRQSFLCVVRNLVFNSVTQIEAYGRGSGIVRLDYRLRAESSGAKFIVLTVADDGPGIHRKYWDAVYEPGVSTLKSGTGFGLSVCRRLTNDAEGRLQLVDSLVYGGTVFSLAWPVGRQ